jgi:hypothetical protein
MSTEAVGGAPGSSPASQYHQAQWDAMVADFTTTLDKFKVPQREQQELITIVGSTKSDIVRPSSTSQQ